MPIFPTITHDTWRARAGEIASVHTLGIEGIAIAALYDRAPGVIAPVPARVPGWSCVQRIEPEVELAAQTAELVAGDVDALWLEARVDGAAHGPATIAALVAALPPGAHALVDDARGGVVLDGIDTSRVRQLAFDPGLAVLRGRCSHAEADDAAIALRRGAPAVRTWCCDGTPWHDAGASAVVELAIVLAELLAALRTGERTDLGTAAVADGLVLRLGLRGDVLVDLAKLRAARALAHACVARLGLTTVAIPLHARGSRRRRTDDDVDTNLVRATLEGFAAALGGADTLALERHDLRGPAVAGARRWARNVTHLLRGESGLDRLDDPAAGAFAIEALTDALARAAWAKLRAIEAAGGLHAAWPELEAEIAATAAARAEVSR